MRVSLIVAWADDQVIGSENELPWRLPADLAHFKRLTMGHHLVLGRKTWDSIGRPLPGRTMVVISRTSPELPEPVRRARTFKEAIDLARGNGEDEVFVAGGASIYALALPIADRIYLTRIDAVIEGDTRFPAVNWREWRQVESVDHVADDSNPYPYRFEIWDRREADPGARDSSLEARAPGEVRD